MKFATTEKNLLETKLWSNNFRSEFFVTKAITKVLTVIEDVVSDVTAKMLHSMEGEGEGSS